MQQFARGLLLMGLSCASLGAFAAEDGALVYETHCASCHDAKVARTPSRETLQAMSPDVIVRSLETGAMRVIGQWNLTGPKRVAVAEFLSGKTYDPNWRDSNKNLCAKPISPSTHTFARPYWNGWAVDDNNTRFQTGAMAGIRKTDLAGLELKWVFAFPGETIVESQPAVIDGRLYTGSRSGMFYALDATSGCTYWTFQADAPIKNAPRIEPIGEHKRLAVFFGDIAGWIYALDAVSGELIWKIRSGGHPSARIVGGFQHHAGALYLGVSSLEEGQSMDPTYPCCSFRGSILKVDAATGRVQWQTYTIDEIPSPQGENKRGKDMIGPSGAAIWSAVTLDHKLGRLYAATSDNYSHPATDTSDSIIALSMDTGKIEWIYQGLSGDVWNSACHIEEDANCPDDAGPDEDMGSSPMLLTLPSGKRLLAAGQKTGILHVLDPDNAGKLLWQKKLAEGGILGGIEWGPATDGKYFYVAKADVTWRDQRFVSSDTELNPNTGGGTIAVDAASGDIVWEAPPLSCEGRKSCSPGQTGAVTAIPGVVFTGSLSGVLQALDAHTGSLLWQYDTVKSYDAVNGARAQGGALDGPGPVVVDGWVYVTSGYAKFGGLPGNVLLAFSKTN